MYTFDCTHRYKGGNKLRWEGAFWLMASDGNHHELRIKGRGSLFDAVIGLSLSGNFICIPQLNFGCALSSLNDINWNTERISAHLTETDAVTIATAIYWFDNSFN